MVNYGRSVWILQIHVCVPVQWVSMSLVISFGAVSTVGLWVPWGAARKLGYLWVLPGSLAYAVIVAH